jgi:hypothetical protein
MATLVMRLFDMLQSSFSAATAALRSSMRTEMQLRMLCVFVPMPSHAVMPAKLDCALRGHVSGSISQFIKSSPCHRGYIFGQRNSHWILHYLMCRSADPSRAI